MSISIKEVQKKTVLRNSSKESSRKESALTQLLQTQIGGSKLKDNFKEHFYSEIALLLDSGLNLKAALDLLLEQQKKESHRILLEKILKELTQGKRFSEILELDKQFTAYEYFSVQIGEETGNLSEILKRLADFFSQRIKQKRNFIGAISYPLVILFTAIIAITFMFYFMVPMFKEVFARMGNNLPSVTKLVIRISENIGPIFGLILVTSLILVTLHLRLRKNLNYRFSLGRALVRIPLVGPLILENNILRMLQSLGLLLRSKVPLVRALDLSSKMLSFYPLQKALQDAQNKVLEGEGFYDGIADNRLLSPKLKGLIKVGEETNNLAFLLEKLSDQTESELEHKAKVLGNTMEPLIIVFLGFFVALILIAMYMPMFQMSASY